MQTPLIEFQNVTKRFGTKTVLDGVNLSIYEGEVTTIIGKSGTGKSVLLKHIIGLLKPDEGTILFEGTAVNKLKRSEWNSYIGQISYMFQNNALFDSMTVFQNIALPLQQTTNLDAETIRKKVMARIEQAELTDAVHKYPAHLSGGMQKRVALSRALVTDPKIVLFDEPTTGQDPVRRNAILGMIAEYQKKLGFTAVLISHEIPDVLFISNRILVLDGGKIIFQGTPEKFDNFDHPFVDEFVSSLEGLQGHLTGIYSMRAFKVRYQNALNKKGIKEHFVIAVFSLDDWAQIGEMVGHEKAQNVLQEIGAYINTHFGVVGGFSSRQRADQFITVLPFSNREEAQNILDGFAKDLNDHGLKDIQRNAELADKECFEFTISAALVEGNADDDLNVMIESAQSRQKPIGRYHCDSEGSNA